MKKNLSLMLGLMMMFSLSVAMVSAQEPISDFAVTAGQTGTADFGTTTTADSLTLGGLVSQIIETSHQTVKMNGVVVSDKTNTTKINNFSLYLFGDITQVNLNNLQSGNIYQTSENVNVRGITGVWTTQNVNSSTVYPTWAKKLLLSTLVTTKFGDNITLTSADPSGTPHTMTMNGVSVLLGDCGSNPNCPSMASLNAAFGTNGDSDSFMGNYTMNGHGYSVIAYRKAPSLWFYAIDASGTGLWQFQNVTTTATGYKVSSQQGQTLALVPAGTFDLFAIIP